MSEGTQVQRTGIVGCAIVRDEERFIEGAVSSLRAICDRVVIVDTGSSDKTLGMARRLADEVDVYPFQGNLADPRNHALSR